MASLYDVMLGIQVKLQDDDFTVYTQKEFDDQGIDVDELAGGTDPTDPLSQFPIIFISTGDETNDVESPLGVLSESGTINLNVVLNTGKSELEPSSAAVLRAIKNTIGSNRANQIWCDWKYTNSRNAVLRGANKDSNVYGGRNINTTVSYREEEIKV